MKAPTVLALLSLPAVLAACAGGGAHSLGPAPESKPPRSFESSTTVTSKAQNVQVSLMPVAIWLVHGNRLQRSIRSTAQTPRVATAALTSLLSAPTEGERYIGKSTAIPAGTRLLGVSIEKGVATVDLTSQFQAGASSSSLKLRLAQIVYTVTEFSTVQKVSFELDGSPVSVFSGTGIVLNHPVGRAAYKALLPHGALAGNWRLLPRSPIAPDFGSATAVWTGKEMLGFGRDTITALDKNGNPYAVKTQSIAAAYTPGKGWLALTPPASSGAAPQMRDRAVWSGKEMLLWGANVAYNPATDSWRRLPAAPAGGGLVVWTGREMVGWGGGCCGDASNDGAAYDPGTNAWRRLARSPLPGSQDPIGAWTGKELIVLAGREAAAYDPAADSWRSIAHVPGSAGGASAVWTGKELVVGGFAYDSKADSWRRLALGRAGRSTAAVWDGNRVLLLGGGAGGSSYSPVDNAWSALPPAPLPAKLEPAAVWTGRSLIVWGGVPTKVWGKFTPAGAIFTPVF